MAKGTVLSFKDDKGYGFIKPEDGAANIYFNMSGAGNESFKDVCVGKIVSYDIHTEGDKVSAINLTAVDGE